MATSSFTSSSRAALKPPLPASFKLSTEVQSNIIAYARGVLAASQNFTEIYNKMEAIDQAYARYKVAAASTSTGVDTVRALGSTVCGAIDTPVTAPIVVSQVDSMVAYLADVYLSGSPMFPVVSTPAKRKWAEQLEVLVDDHATLGGYARQLLMLFRDGIKYNICALEADWSLVEQFSVNADFEQKSGTSISRTNKYFTRLKRLDPYNLVWDYNVAPGDVSAEGDYAGYVQVLSRTKLKRLLNRFTATDEAYNVSAALNSVGGTDTGGSATSSYYRMHPTVSNYVSARSPTNQVDWTAYLTGVPFSRGSNITPGTNYEIFTLYARIQPSDFGIPGPQQNTPQIWKFVVVNGSILVHAKRIISAYDYLPILFGQPLEDGLGYQTQSIAEGEIPIQDAATTLFNIRFSAARRSVSDRALYNPALINPSDINAPVPAPKIPVRLNIMSPLGLDQAYKQIPFDTRGTDSTIQDAATIVGFSKELSGLNGPQQGQFQKGNKSVQEWNDTMGGSDNRLRLPALCYEHQVFAPLKAIISLNIFQHGEDTEVVSQKTGETISIDIAQLRQQVLSFRVADGYTPKSKLASTDMLTQGLTLIMNSPILQQAYGPMLPSMFAHMMELGGVRGLDEYAPQAPGQQDASQLPGNLAVNALQSPTAPMPGQTPVPGTPTAGAPPPASASSQQAALLASSPPAPSLNSLIGNPQ